MALNAKRKLRKILSALLALVILLGIIPVSTFAENADEDFFCLQVIKDGIPVPDDSEIPCEITNGEDLTDSGATSVNGVWKTDLTVDEVYQKEGSLTFTIDSKELTAEIGSVELEDKGQFIIVDITEEDLVFCFSKKQISVLKGFESVSPINNIANGTEASASAFGLPGTVTAVTSAGNETANVSWDISAYEKDKYTAQSFTAIGTVSLPGNVVATDSDMCTITTSVSVNACEDAQIMISAENGEEVSVGQTIALSASFERAKNETAKWYKNSVSEENSVPGSDAVEIKDAQISDAGTYICRVEGLNGVVKEESITISVVRNSSGLALTANVSENARPAGTNLTVNINQEATGKVDILYSTDGINFSDYETVTLDGKDEYVVGPFKAKGSQNSYIFKAVYSGDQKFNEDEKEINFDFEKGEQTTPVINGVPMEELQFSSDADKNTFTVSAEGGESTGEYVYEISGQKDLDDNTTDNVAAVDSEGKVEILRSGKFQIRVMKLGDDDYNDSQYCESAVVTVTKAEQTGFRIKLVENTYECEENNTENNAVIYGKNDNKFLRVADGGQSENAVEYSIKETKNLGGNEITDTVADVDIATGELTIKRSGIVTVEAKKPGDSKYSDAFAEYTLEIRKAEVTMEFETHEPGEKSYGLEKFENPIITEFDDEIEIIYSIVNEDGKEVADINAKTGTLSFKAGQYGTVTVQARREETEIYTEALATYTIAIAEIESVSFFDCGALEGEMINGWYKDRVKVYSPDNSYKYSNKVLAFIPYDFEDEFKIEESFNGDFDIMAKEKKLLFPAIKKTIIKNLKIDADDPAELDVSFEESTVQKVLELVTFGNYEPKVKVKFSAKDAYSGVKKFEWSYTAEDKTELMRGEYTFETAENDASYVWEMTYEEAQQFKGSFVLKAYDGVGHYAELASEKVLVIDSIAPEIEVDYEGALTDEDDNTRYYSSDVKVEIKVEEENFYPENTVIKVNGKEVTDAGSLEWKVVEGKHVATYTLKCDEGKEEDITLSIEHKDYSNNKKVYNYEKTISIDKKNPEVTAKAPSGYISTDGKLDIKVVEHNFDASKVEAVISSENAYGDVINKDEIDNIIGSIKDIDKWNYEGNDTWTISVSLPADAVYEGIVNFKDKAGHLSSSEKFAFVADKTAVNAEDIRITYSTPILTDVWELVTFGYYNPDVTVSVTSKQDNISKIKEITLNYAKLKDASKVNKDSETLKCTADKFTYLDDENKETDEAKATYVRADFVLESSKIGDQYCGNVSAEVNNYAELSTIVSDDPSKAFVVDTIEPKREVIFDQAIVCDLEGNMIEAKEIPAYEDNDNVALYYKETAVVKFRIDEANFTYTDINNKDKCNIFVIKDGEKYSANPETWTNVGDDFYEGTIVLSGNGKYTVEMQYTDRSSNVMKDYTSPAIYIDNTPPEIKVSYKSDKEPVNGKYYQIPRTAVISVFEDNFYAPFVDIDVSAKDIKGNDVDVIDFKAYLHDRNNWHLDDGIYTAEVPFTEDAIYNFTVDAKDIIGNEAETYAADEFVIDKTKPVVKDIECGETNLITEVAEAVTFGYYKPSTVVVVTAEDMTSGIKDAKLTYTREDGASLKNVEFQEFTPAIIEQDKNDKEKFIIKFVVPNEENTEELQYRGSFSAVVTDNAEWESEEPFEDEDYVTVIDTISPTRSVAFSEVQIRDRQKMNILDEFKEGDDVILYNKTSVTLTFTIDEANFYPEDINAENPVNKDLACSLIVYRDGQAMKANPTDWSKNGDTWTGSITLSGDGDYFVEMRYSDRSSNEMKAYTSPEIRIDSTPPVISVEYLCEVSVVNGKYYSKPRTAVITVDEHNFISDYVDINVRALDITGAAVSVQNYDSYLKADGNWTHTGNIHRATIVFDADAIYNFEIYCRDILGNIAQPYISEEFVVDKTAPDASKITISYSQSLTSKVINLITYGYYNPDVIVTVTAEDITSGIKSFELTYTKENGASNINVESEKFEPLSIQQNSDKKTFTATFKLPSEVAKQYRGSMSVIATNYAELTSETKNDDNNIIVIDTISPTRRVEFSPAKQIVMADSLTTVAEYDYATEGSQYKLYYDADATATIVVEEANFYPEDVVIKINDQPYTSANWNSNGDTHTATITFAGDGHYVLSMSYVDRSQNKMVDYVSNEITVDTVKPVIKVEYSPNKVIRTKGENKYYNEVQTATITVTEHNFRADDIAAVITAKDVTGADVKVTDFSNYLKDRSSWTRNGDDNVAVIKYSADANYTFDIDYKDLALINIDDYKADAFTVDTKAPMNLKIEYSTSVFETVMESVSFGFYNAKMDVKITAEDETSGINDFVYSYIKAKGVSGVNAELIDQAVAEAEIKYLNSGKTATTTFSIPKYTLKGDNQFRGTVKFTAKDRSDNKAEKVDTKTLVVDNIAPTAVVTYNQPVSTSNGVSYYAGNVNATIRITEANFYPQDVVVTVNGQARKVANWSKSGDTWQGNIVISENGDYRIKISYKDRSQNVMKTYESNQLTIDATKPTITLSGIKNHSANKAEKIGFTIQASDTNFEVGNFRPVLTSIYMKADGTYGSKVVNIGKPITIAAGKTYAYVVDNLSEDAIYSLTCNATDKSGNSNNVMTVTDSKNAQLSQVVFSVNRNGSTYKIDSYTSSVTEAFYNQKVTKDIVITEINVDPLKDYKVEINGKELVEGKDFTVTKKENPGVWCEYVYTINKSLFKNEDAYSVVISSTDKTGSKAYNDMKDAKISFVVDRSKPQILVSGLKQGGIYKTNNQKVTLVLSDDGGRIASIKVVVKDKNGKVIGVPVNISGDKLTALLDSNSNKVSFEIGEQEDYQNIELICIDEAGNEFNSSKEYYNITVSSNKWITFWANPLYRWGTIGGTVAAAAGITFLIIFLKKRKKDEDEEATA